MLQFFKTFAQKEFWSRISSCNRFLRLAAIGLHHIRVMEKLEYLKLEHLPGIVNDDLLDKDLYLPHLCNI
jgi:hypothetical protein